jgi:hypothetical protein
VPEEAVDLGVRRENVLAALAATHAAQHVDLVALLVQVEKASIVKCFSHLVDSFSQRPLSRCTAHRLGPTLTAYMPVQVLHVAAAVRQLDEALEHAEAHLCIVGDAHYLRRHPAVDAVELV